MNGEEMPINWNIPDKAIERAFKKLVKEFDEQLRSEIADEKWDWDNLTVRRVGRGKTGKYATSPRDIVDTGELQDSQHIEEVSDTEVIYHWDSGHAAIAHQGAVLSNGGIIAARPWTDTAQEEYPLQENFERILGEELGGESP